MGLRLGRRDRKKLNPSSSREALARACTAEPLPHDPVRLSPSTPFATSQAPMATSSSETTPFAHLNAASHGFERADMDTAQATPSQHMPRASTSRSSTTSTSLSPVAQLLRESPTRAMTPSVAAIQARNRIARLEQQQEASRLCIPEAVHVRAHPCGMSPNYDLVHRTHPESIPSPTGVDKPRSGTTWGPFAEPMKRRYRALLVGISYAYNPDVKTLQGAMSDVREIFKLVTNDIGYAVDDVRVLADEPLDIGETHVREPTMQNIFEGMTWLVDNMQAGDACFFFFAGHGDHIPDLNDDEEDGMDQVILPSNSDKAGVIVDDSIYERMVRGVPPGARLTAVVDACRSGSVLDLPVQYQYREALGSPEPFPSYSMTSEPVHPDTTESNADDSCDVTPLDAAGDLASEIDRSTRSIVDEFENENCESSTVSGIDVREQSGLLLDGDSSASLTSQPLATAYPVEAAPTIRQRPPSSAVQTRCQDPPRYRRIERLAAGETVLFSGSSDLQLSTDAPVEGQEGVSMGVFTNCFTNTVRSMLSSGPPLTYGELLDAVKDSVIPRVRQVTLGGNNQVPQLSASHAFDIYETPFAM